MSYFTHFNKSFNKLYNATFFNVSSDGNNLEILFSTSFNLFSNSLFFGILRVYFFASTPKELKLILTPVSEISSLIFSDNSNKSSNSCNAFLIFS